MKRDLSSDLPYPELKLYNDDIQALEKPDPVAPRRSFSCPGQLQCQFESTMDTHHHRIHIAYYNEAVRERSQANAQRLLLLAAAAIASTTDETSNSDDVSEGNATILARKALRYRKIYDRMSGVDVTDPCFNASQFLGVTWHKLVP
ncbi:hypothetical protein Gpo141_00009298 [Globisporangium polare]